MNKLSKMVTSVAAASVLASGVYAEESGVFVGLEAGASIMNTQSETTDFKDSKYGFGGNYGFIIGYKQFFNPHIGLRYYANINYMQANVFASGAPNAIGARTVYGGYSSGRVHKTNLVNYGVNVDFLGNFIAKENVDFGGFVGLGIGGNTYLFDPDIISNTSETQSKVIQAQETTTFNTALNIGLRSNIFKNHGIELVAKVPFIGQKFVDTTRADGAPLKMTRTYYSVALRYTYSF